jgi:hypothetical protein
MGYAGQVDFADFFKFFFCAICGQKVFGIGPSFLSRERRLFVFNNALRKEVKQTKK